MVKAGDLIWSYGRAGPLTVRSETSTTYRVFDSSGNKFSVYLSDVCDEKAARESRVRRLWGQLRWCVNQIRLEKNRIDELEEQQS